MLSDDELGRLHRAIHIAHEARDRDGFADVAMDAVETCVSSEFTGYNEVDPRSDRFRFVVRPEELIFDGVGELMALHAGDHPLIRHIQETGDGSAHKISDFVDLPTFRRTRLYQEVYSRVGVDWQMSLNLPAPEPRIVAVVVTRPERLPDFDERDRLLLNQLRPHLAQSYTLAREREHVRNLLDAATGALVSDSRHLIALDDPPYELTPGAMTTLYRAFGPPERVDPLPARVGRWLQRQREQWTDSTGRPAPGLLRPLVAERDGQRVVMQLVPGRDFDCLLLREEESAPATDDLRSLGLTAREAEVLHHLAGGDTNAAIARALHVEPSTVKTHLERIYRKLGVRGRVDAVAIAIELLAGESG